MKFKQILKNKSFWGGVFTTIGALITGSIAIPDAISTILNLF